VADFKPSTGFGIGLKFLSLLDILRLFLGRCHKPQYLVVFILEVAARVLKDSSDEELMTLYQLGDESAFAELYARHSGRVLAFLRSRVGGEPLARDIFQATFMKLHRSRSQYDRRYPFTPWLFTICRSELLDAVKAQSRRLEDPVAELPEVVPGVRNEPDLSQLSTRHHEALVLRFGEGFSFEEVAEALKTSPANARQIVSRAVKILRGIYGKK
jgi:RNA polymerase sigma factor (sigma-70 family)